MCEEIGVSPAQVWGNLSRPVVSLKMENVYACVGYIGHVEELNFKLSADEVCISYLNVFVLTLISLSMYTLSVYIGCLEPKLSVNG